MTLQEKVSGGDPRSFLLIDKTPGSDLRILCQTQGDEDKRTWVTHIRKLLDLQADLLSGK